jgi:spermidine/putrescine transport system substrate-binding protein
MDRDLGAQRRERELAGLTRELAGKRITRLQFLERALALGLSATAIAPIIAACGGGDDTSTPAAMDTTKPETLSIWSWAEYLAPAVKKGFEKKTGIKITESSYDSNEAVIAKLKAGTEGFDIVVPSDSSVHVMSMSGLLEPLDMTYIPNFQYVGETFRKPDYDPEDDGKKYSVPYQWGATGIGVRADKVASEITGWKDMWDTRYKGDIVMLNEEREVVGAGLFVLGYSFNSTSEDEIDQATEKLIEQKPLVLAYDSSNQRRNMMNGVALTQAWQDQALSVLDEIGEDKFKFVLPSERFLIWIDNLCIPKGASSPYAAHLFMDYILDPKISAANTGWIWCMSPVPSCYDYMEGETGTFLKAHYPTEEDLKRSEVGKDLGEFIVHYQEAWKKVMAA